MDGSAHSILPVRIAEIISETTSSKTFQLEFPGGAEPFYKPGQFLTLVFYNSLGEKRRSYSICSSPAAQERLSITVKRVDNGEFSRFLIDKAEKADMLFTSGVSGLFLLPNEIRNSQQFFFIAAGSGITPCFSMIKTLLLQTAAEVVLIYSNRNINDCIFRKQLNNLEAIYPGRFSIYFLFSEQPDIYHSRLSKWLLQQLLDKFLKVQRENALFYLCGPFEFMRTATITLLERIPAANIFRETFNILPHIVIPQPPDLRAHTVSIRMHEVEYKLQVQYPQSILAAAKSQNVLLPYSCEAGRCGSCVATCISGEVWMAYNEVLTEDEVGRGRVLLCQGYPVRGDVEVVVD